MQFRFFHIGDSSHNFSRDLLIALFLLVITFTVYYQVRNYNFINLDDGAYVYENLHIQEGFTLNSVKWAFTTVHAANWHPITWLSLMLDSQLFGLNPGYFHLTNLFFHIVNTLLLFFIFREMTGMAWPSAFIAALFGLHPLHVESVAWISERKDVLSTFFFLLTLWSYSRYVERPSAGRYCMVPIFFALGLMSKPMLVTLPFVLLLLDAWPFYRFRFQSSDIYTESKQQQLPLFYLILEKIPLFVLSALSSAITLYAQRQGRAIWSLTMIPFSERIANTLVAYMSYIGKTICPINLAIFYPYSNAHPWWEILVACLLLGDITYFAIKTMKQHPYFIVGWLWYLGTMIPVIGLVQVGNQAMADRYTYIPLIGLFVIIAWGVPNLISQWRHKKIYLATSATLIIFILSAITFNQTSYWKNNVTLYKHAIQATSDNYLAHINLGVTLQRQGHIKEAIRQYLYAIRIRPNDPDAHNNLGVALQDLGHVKKAIRQYLYAIRIKPNNVKALYNLGIAYFSAGDIDKSVVCLQKALKLNPNSHNIQTALEKASAAQTQNR